MLSASPLIMRLAHHLIYVDSLAVISSPCQNGSVPEGLLAVYQPDIFHFLKRTHFKGQLFPVVPNVAQYVREMSSHGMAGMALLQVKKLGFRGLQRVGCQVMRKALAIQKRDFTALLPILVDMEMIQFRRFSPPAVVLNAQLTDLALANGNVRLFSTFARVVRKRYGALPGVETYNFGLLLPLLDEWRLDVPLIVTPINQTGFLMRPSAATCLQQLQSTSRHVIALQADDDPGWEQFLDRLGVVGRAFRSNGQPTR